MTDDVASDTDNSEEEGILSDVHVGPKPARTEDGQFVSRFHYRFPVPHQVPGAAPAEPQYDADGDLIVQRNQDLAEDQLGVITIVHSLDTPLEAVGLQVWRGALLLGDYLIAQPQLLSGKTVLEVGAGSGFAGILAARSARRVFITDIGEAVLANCLRNVRVNLAIGEVEGPQLGAALVREFDWTQADHLCPLLTYKVTCSNKNSPFEWLQEDLEELKDLDFILAADVVYDLPATSALFSKVEKLMALTRTARGKSVRMLLSIEKRINFSLDELSIVAPAYDHFRSLFSTLPVVNAEHSGLVGRPVELDEASEHFDYDRNAQLELWEIWLS